MFGSFAERHLVALDTAGLDAYERLLAEEDPDLWDWVTGHAPVPARHDTKVMALLRDFSYMPKPT